MRETSERLAAVRCHRPCRIDAPRSAVGYNVNRSRSDVRTAGAIRVAASVAETRGVTDGAAGTQRRQPLGIESEFRLQHLVRVLTETRRAGHLDH